MIDKNAVRKTETYKFIIKYLEVPDMIDILLITQKRIRDYIYENERHYDIDVLIGIERVLIQAIRDKDKFGIHNNL